MKMLTEKLLQSVLLNVIRFVFIEKVQNSDYQLLSKLHETLTFCSIKYYVGEKINLVLFCDANYYHHNARADAHLGLKK